MFKKDFTLNSLNTHPRKTFSPMRIILKNDSLYYELIDFSKEYNIKNKNNELIIKTIFSWNEIFPFGFSTFSNVNISQSSKNENIFFTLLLILLYTHFKWKCRNTGI